MLFTEAQLQKLKSDFISYLPPPPTLSFQKRSWIHPSGGNQKERPETKIVDLVLSISRDLPYPMKEMGTRSWGI